LIATCGFATDFTFGAAFGVVTTFAVLFVLDRCVIFAFVITFGFVVAVDFAAAVGFAVALGFPSTLGLATAFDTAFAVGAVFSKSEVIWPRAAGRATFFVAAALVTVFGLRVVDVMAINSFHSI
jgi:hypothetical protein